MEALSVKAGIFASLFGFLGIIGLVVLLAAVIWLIIRVANFDSVLPALLIVLLSIGLIAGGLVLSPAPDYQPEPLKMPWETLLDWVVSLKDRKSEDGEVPSSEDGGSAPEGEESASENGESAQPELEKMEVVHTSAPAESAEPTAASIENPAEAAPAAASEDQNRLLVDEVISGWRVRLTLPREWKDLCVVKNSGSWLDFSHKAALGDEDGWLFSLSVHEGPYDVYGDESFPSCEIMLEKDGMTLLAVYPTDVQFDMEHMDVYNRMQEEIPGILSTIEFERA